MYFPGRGCVRPLRHLYGYATGHRSCSAASPGCIRLTVLPATRQRRHSRPYPSRSWYSSWSRLRPTALRRRRRRIDAFRSVWIGDASDDHRACVRACVCVCVCVCVVVVVVDRDGAGRPPPVRAGGGAGRRRGALRLGARCDGAGGEPREPRPGRRRPPLTASIPSPPGHRSRPAMLQRLTVTYVTVVLTTLAAIIDPGLTLARFPLIISSPVRERGIAMSVSVCLSVCSPADIPPEPRIRTSLCGIFSVRVACGSGSVLL